jgi:hypothetical protein
MTITDEIIAIANALAEQGKKPSVALIKPRLSSPVALPIIINTLKSWQYQPNVNVKHQQPIPPKGVDEVQAITLAELNQAIARAIMPLTHEIHELKQQIVQLSQQLNQS